MFKRWLVATCIGTAVLLAGGLGANAEELYISTFNVDATPPLGAPLCNGNVQPAKTIVDPLSARGVVLFPDGQPIVLCAVDWVGIGNEGYDAFRRSLAEAAGTTPERVAVHCLHPHDAPACDFSTEELLVPYDLGGQMFDVDFARDVIGRVAGAVRACLENRQPATHIGLGVGRVEEVASNRRILGEDGKVAIVRFSSTRNKKAIEAPEGVVDPNVKLLSFWNQETPLLSVTHYATHPQSYYGQGGVSADFVGLARRLREQDLSAVEHVHFNGASGNVAAGKYNDGSPVMRARLAERLARGMEIAWDEQEKRPITAADVDWFVRPVALPVRDTLQRDELEARLKDTNVERKKRIRAARDLAFLHRMEAGVEIPIACLRLGSARVLYMPGELFVEYQLAAQRSRPDDFTAMAAYGDYGPGYIGTKIAYSQGGYETGIVSRTAPGVERVIMDAVEELLGRRGSANRPPAK